jgi:hypothetical protein
MKIIRTPIAKLDFKPNYLVHILPLCDQCGNKKANNVTIVESGKQAPTEKYGKKTITMHVQVHIVSTLLIKLVLGFNRGQVIC